MGPLLLTPVHSSLHLTCVPLLTSRQVEPGLIISPFSVSDWTCALGSRFKALSAKLLPPRPVSGLGDPPGRGCEVPSERPLGSAFRSPGRRLGAGSELGAGGNTLARTLQPAPFGEGSSGSRSRSLGPASRPAAGSRGD